MDFCLLFTRLRDSYGRSARGGPCAIRNKRVLDAPSFAVTRRLLAAARIWIMMRAPLQDHRITIPPSYVKQLRAQFMRISFDLLLAAKVKTTYKARCVPIFSSCAMFAYAEYRNTGLLHASTGNSISSYLKDSLRCWAPASGSRNCRKLGGGPMTSN